MSRTAAHDKFKKDLEDATKKFDKRTEQFAATEAKGREDLAKTEDEKQKAERNLTHLKNQTHGIDEQQPKVIELTRRR